ncbi:hypothetical protein GUITHDRAFT_52457, partial [Guillardia theta CCMP2712]
ILDDLFPAHIASALREGRKVEPEHKEMVTVFFAEIYGYSSLSTEMSTSALLDMLHRFYVALDAYAQECEVYKLETIGATYMAITNLVEDQDSSHAVKIVKFAMGAVRIASSTFIDLADPSKGVVQIQVGVHSGPIVANVVGTRRPKYTLFGDTVNTASRMESLSLPGEIQCSGMQPEDLDFVLVSRGEIAVKGKGQMHTFWIRSK